MGTARTQQGSLGHDTVQVVFPHSNSASAGRASSPTRQHCGNVYVKHVRGCQESPTYGQRVAAAPFDSREAISSGQADRRAVDLSGGESRDRATENEKPLVSRENTRGSRHARYGELPDQDSNLDKQNQNLLCYRYTIGHPAGRTLSDAARCWQV